MFTLLSKFWMLISISVLIFVSGMLYANASTGAPYSVSAVKSLFQKTESLNLKAMDLPKVKSVLFQTPATAQNPVTLNAVTPYRAPVPSTNTKSLAKKLSSAVWIKAQAGPGACVSKPMQQWSFTEQSKASGFQCLKTSELNGQPVYSCGLKQSSRRKNYFLETGSYVFDAGTDNRPYVTLARVNRPAQTISLKQCMERDKTWSPDIILEDET